MTQSLTFIYTTFPDKISAEDMLTGLLHQGLIACGNLYQPHTSYYRWAGKFEQSQECTALLKLPTHNYDAVEAYIRQHHPYECPCIVGFKADSAAPAFMDWVYKEASAEQSSASA